jgi:hypothetical protein
MQPAHLTRNGAGVKGRSMTRSLTIIAIAAAAAGLSACDNSDHTIVGGPNIDDPMANAVQNLDQVELPPTIVASHAYRCKDNSLVYIDWLSNDTARIKKDRHEVGTTLTRGEDGNLAAEGQSVSGTATDPSVTVNGQSCKR